MYPEAVSDLRLVGGSKFHRGIGRGINIGSHGSDSSSGCCGISMDPVAAITTNCVGCKMLNDLG